MNLFALSPDWVVWILAPLLAAAAIQDTIQLKISNFITGLVLLLAVVAMFVTGLQVSLWQNFAVFLVLLVIGTMLFARSILGGGDVKLLAALGLWANGATSLRLLAAVFLAGGVLALVILVLRMVTSERLTARVKTLQRGAGIPYGIAIAIGTMAVLFMSRAQSAAGTYTSNLNALG